MRHTAVFLLGSLAILVSFFFLFLPMSARLVELISNTKGDAQQIVEEETIRSPELQPLLEATNSATIAIHGYVQSDQNVRLFRNGSQVDETQANPEGLFSFSTVSLQEGENQFFVKALSPSGKESDPSIQYSVVYKTSAPTLEVESPTDGMTVTSRKDQVLVVSGKTDPGTKVYLNDRLLLVDSEGTFSGNFQLATQENVLVFKAVDIAGNATTVEMRVTYLP